MTLSIDRFPRTMVDMEEEAIAWNLVNMVLVKVAFEWTDFDNYFMGMDMRAYSSIEAFDGFDDFKSYSCSINNISHFQHYHREACYPDHLPRYTKFLLLFLPQQALIGIWTLLF